MAFAFFYGVEYIVACFVAPSKEDERLHPILKSKFVCPLYANPAVYKTPFPMLSAFTLILNGVWWYQMAYYLFAENLELSMKDLDNPHMGPMYVGGLFYNTLIFTAAGLVLVHIVGGWLDANMYPGKRASTVEDVSEMEA
jgi:hypothetical protein